MAELEEAAELLEVSSQRIERARALAALGAELPRARRPTDARDRCGSRSSYARSPARRRSRSTCARSSTPPAPGRARRRSAGVESLTERERRVATLAADGETNRDIAQALYVTPKTGVDLGGREQLELERRDDAVVAAAAADRPEQVGLVVVVDARRAVEGGETRLGGGLRRSSPSAVTISTAVTAFA